MRYLRKLLKLRHITVCQAKVALAAAVAAEEAAAVFETAAADLIRNEIEAASNETADDAAVEALSTWLPLARQRQIAANIRLQAAEVATARARAALAAARASEAAVEYLLNTRAVEMRTEADRQGRADLLDRLCAPRTDGLE